MTKADFRAVYEYLASDGRRKSSCVGQAKMRRITGEGMSSKGKGPLGNGPSDTGKATGTGPPYWHDDILAQRGMSRASSAGREREVTTAACLKQRGVERAGSRATPRLEAPARTEMGSPPTRSGRT
jgi:hypothetical protein